MRKGPETMFADVVSDIPTLIVQGDLAYTSTPQGTAHLQSGLSNSTLLLFPTLGTGTAPFGLLADGVPPCLNDLRRSFLATPARHLDAAACAKQSSPIEFVAATR